MDEQVTFHPQDVKQERRIISLRNIQGKQVLRLVIDYAWENDREDVQVSVEIPEEASQISLKGFENNKTSLDEYPLRISGLNLDYEISHEE